MWIWLEFTFKLKKQMLTTWFIQKAMASIDLNKLFRIYRYIAN